MDETCRNCDRPPYGNSYTSTMVFCCTNCGVPGRRRNAHTVDCDIKERIRRSREARKI